MQNTWGMLAEKMAHVPQAFPLYVASILYRFMMQALTGQDHLSTLSVANINVFSSHEGQVNSCQQLDTQVENQLN